MKYKPAKPELSNLSFDRHPIRRKTGRAREEKQARRSRKTRGGRGERRRGAADHLLGERVDAGEAALGDDEALELVGLRVQLLLLRRHHRGDRARAAPLDEGAGRGLEGGELHGARGRLRIRRLPPPPRSPSAPGLLGFGGGARGSRGGGDASGRRRGRDGDATGADGQMRCGSFFFLSLSPLLVGLVLDCAVGPVSVPVFFLVMNRDEKQSPSFLNKKVYLYLPYAFKTGKNARMTEVIYMKVM